MMTHKTTTSTAKFARALSYSVAVAAIVSLLPHTSRAAPVGGVVASGSASISASGLETTINQTSDRAVIDWQSFNLSHNETARFVVPSDSSATLNRISGGVSTISGSVESNGTVYFANPNGLVFDATSRVTANGFVATTGTIPNFDFMNRGEFAGHNANQVTLNGAILASAITVQSGTVTVGGNLSAGSGKILLSSTTLTTIGAGAVISADGGAAGNGGNIKIWSDSHTDFLGSITARGGTNTGDGGFVEVSGKATLNFAGTVSTLAAHGKTGTLLLDPANIEIVTAVPATPTAKVSYITVSNLQAALGTSNVTIDANTPSTTGISPAPTLTNDGYGLITVSDPIVAATTGASSLTLTGAQIIIKANITMITGGNLILNATRASVWQNPTTVIAANRISGSSVDGFILNGANLFTNLGAITNSGTAGISIKNNKNFSIDSGITLAGGTTGGVSILAEDRGIVLNGPLTVLGSYLRLDVGDTGTVGGNFITALGLALYWTSATTGNNVIIPVGSGSFTFVNDKRTVTTSTTLDNSTTDSTATIGWGSGISLTAGTTISGTTPYNGGGLSINTTGAASSVTNQGVVYGGQVILSSVGSGTGTGTAKNLRYIEGTNVYSSGTNTNAFTGSLALVGSGSSYLLGSGVFMDSGATLTTGAENDGTSHLLLLQNNYVTSDAVSIIGATVKAGGDLTIVQTGLVTGVGQTSGIYIGPDNSPLAQVPAGDPILSQVTAGGAMTLTASGYSASSTTDLTRNHNGILMSSSDLSSKKSLRMIQSGYSEKGYGIIYTTTSVTSGADVIMTQSGIAKEFGIVASGLSSVTAAAAVTLTQSGYAGVYGIIASGTLTAGSDLSLLQTGSAGTAGNFPGIQISPGTFLSTHQVSFSAPNGWVTLKTNNTDLILNGYSNSKLSSGRVRIDLGSGVMSSYSGTIPTGGYILSAPGLEVYFTGGTTGTATIAVGSGSFTFVGNGGSGNGTLINSTTLAYLGLDGVTYGGSAVVRTLGDLTITGSIPSALTGKGVRFGGTVSISGVTSDSVVGGLRLIEGGGISVLSTSAFSGKLTLVGNGAGDIGYKQVIRVAANLTTGTADDGVSDLTLIGTASATARFGLEINSATVTAGGNLTVINHGVNGIILGASATTGVSLVSGTNNWVKLQTVVTGVTLSTTNNFTVTSRSLRLDLGKLGALTSSGGTNFTLNAAGSDVYFTGSTTNAATIAVGSGSFTFVNDKRDTTTDTVLGNTTIASVAGLGTFTLTNGSGTLGGLTVTTTGAVTTINRQGVVYGGTVTINGVTTGNATGNPMNFTYIEGTKIEVSTTASTFAGPLALVANGVNGIDLGIGLTASGNISILAPKVSMKASVTVTPSTMLTINLGGGQFVNGAGAGFTLTTSSKNLTFIAGNVFNTTASNAVFNLGLTGTLTLKGLGLAQGGGQAGGATTLYEGDYINADNDLAEASVTSYYFTSLEGADLAAAKTRVNDSAARWLSAAALTAPGGDLGKKYTGTGLAKYTSAGFSGSTGSISWKNAGTVTGSISSETAYTLQGGKTVHFYGVTRSTMWGYGSGPTVLSNASAIIFDSANVFTNGLNLNCNCAVTQSSGSTLAVSGGLLNINAGGEINLSQTGNQLNSLGTINAGTTTSSNLSIASGTALTLNGSLSGQGGTITIRVKDGNLKLAVNQTSTSGSLVTIDLGTGVYDASSTSATAVFTWTTGGKSLDLTVGGIKAGTGTVFALGAGTLTHNLNFTSKSFGTNLYFSNDRSITANNIKELTNDPTAEYRSLDVLGTGLTSGSGFSGTTGNITLSSTTVYAGADNTVTFWNVRNGVVNARLNVKEIRFGGAQNSFSEFNHIVVANSERAAMTILAGSVLRGNIKIGSAGLTFESGARATGGTISSAISSNTFTSLNFVGDFVQQSGDSDFNLSLTTVKITSQGSSIRFIQPGYWPNNLEVTTNGGNFQIASTSYLNFTKLDTAGGWVVLDTTGKIDARNVSAGSVSFRAGGSVSLNGAFAAASGTGSSIVLNNSAVGAVLGGIRSDSSLSITGSGSSILVGDIIGGAGVAITTPTVVARDSAVVSNGGRVEFARGAAALNALVGLRVDAGFGGVIALGGSIGSPSLSLGWVELTGLISNPSGNGIYYTGGSLISTDRLRNWRNGTGL